MNNFHYHLIKLYREEENSFLAGDDVHIKSKIITYIILDQKM